MIWLPWLGEHDNPAIMPVTIVIESAVFLMLFHWLDLLLKKLKLT